MAVDFKLIGARVQNIRKERKMTQEVLAEKLDVSVGYVSQIERGITKANLEMLAEISATLDCDLAFLICGATRGRQEYLEDEFLQKFDLLTDREKNIVLTLIHSLLENR